MGTILVDSAEAEKSLSRTDKSTKTLGQRLGGGIKTAAKWGAALVGATVAVAAGAFAMTKKVTAGFDDIAKNSRKMGISTDYYQEMDYWASQNGLSHENMEKSMKRLNQRLGQAVDGNKKYSEALTRLGVDMEAVEAGTVSTEEAMTQSIQALSEMENSQEKAALASELFGTKLSQELMPALDSGALSIEDAQKKAEELGIVIGEDTLNAAESFNDTWDDLTRMMGAFGQKIIAELMPIFQVMMDWVMDKMPLIQEITSKAFEFIGIAMGKIRDIVMEELIPRLQDLWAWIEPHLPMIQGLFEEAFEYAKVVIQETIDVIKDITKWIQEHWAVFEPILLGIGAGIVVFKLITGAIALWTTVTAIATGVAGAFGAAIAFLTSPIGIVVVIIGVLIAAGVALWKNWDVIKEKLSQFWNKIKSTFDNIKTKITDTFNKLKDDALNWGKNMINGFIDGIKSMAGKVGEAAKGVVSGIGDFLKFWSPAKKGEGRYIVHWGRNMVDGFLDGVEDEKINAGVVMNSVVDEMNPSKMPGSPKSVSPSSIQSNNNNGMIESLLMEMIEAVREGQNISLFPDGETFARKTGDYTAQEGGTRVRRVERGLAT